MKTVESEKKELTLKVALLEKETEQLEVVHREVILLEHKNKEHDSKIKDAEKLVQKYFAGLSPAAPITRVRRQDSNLAGPVDISMSDNVELERLSR